MSAPRGGKPEVIDLFTWFEEVQCPAEPSSAAGEPSWVTAGAVPVNGGGGAPASGEPVHALPSRLKPVVNGYLRDGSACARVICELLIRETAPRMPVLDRQAVPVPVRMHVYRERASVRPCRGPLARRPAMPALIVINAAEPGEW